MNNKKKQVNKRCVVITCAIVQYILLFCAFVFLLWFSIIEIFYQNGQCASINVTQFLHEDKNTSLIDTRLKLNDLTILGTHNSYHKSNLFSHYSHLTVDQQFLLNVRQIEIDVHLMKNNLVVYHLQLWDDRTNCYCFKSCLMKIVQWINENPFHYPIYLFIEIKQMIYEDFITGITGVHCEHLQQIRNEILNIFSLNTFITSSQIQGNQSTLSLALKSQRYSELSGDYTYYNYGWPPVYQSLGKIIPVFLDDVHNRAIGLYSQCDALQNFFLIAQTNVNLTYSSIITLSNSNSDIQKLINIQNSGLITRVLLGYGTDNLNQSYQTMKTNGIHIISTDYEQCNDTSFCQTIKNDFGTYPVLCNMYYAPTFCNLSSSYSFL